MRLTATVVCLIGATLITHAQTPVLPDEAQTAASVVAQTAAPDERPSFADWLVDVRAEARTRGIREEVIDQALGDLPEPLPISIERDRAQVETVLPLETYITRRLTPRLIRTGRQRSTLERATLERVAERYGVPVRIIAGVWGIESNFGGFTGVQPTVPALATLAWDPRRSALFRRELFDALEILNRGDIEIARMRGSWAGAMGQPQFMPSSYLQYAEDFDGDGRRDIWNTSGDVFASIANYLKGKGWKTGQAWGREVKIPKASAARIAGTVARRTGGCRAVRDMTTALPLAKWRELGVRSLSGAPLPRGTARASLVSGSTRHFLVYENYDALLQYNCAHAYALSVVLLGDRVWVPAQAKPPAAMK